MKNKPIPSLFMLLVLLVSFIAPMPAYAKDTNVQPQVTTASWTVLIYIAGDNNLEAAGVEDFLELAVNGSTPNVNYLVLFDRSAGYDSSYGDWTDTKLFRVTRGMTPTAENALADWGEMNMGDVQTLKDFITYGVNNYPATKYSLILWNHGGGFLPASVEQNSKANAPIDSGFSAAGEFSTNGVAWDDTDNSDFLTNLEVQEAAQAMVNQTGKRVELFGFDACLMAMMEVDYVIKDYANYRVSSQANEPGDGWDYTALSRNLNKNYKWDGKKLAGDIVKSYYASYNGETLSAVQFGANYEAMLTAFNALGNQLIASLPDEGANIQAAFNVSTMPIFDSYEYYDVIYMMDQVSKRTTNANLKKAALTFVKAAKKVVIANKVGADWKNSFGMAIYYPYYAAGWNAERADYLALQPFSNTNWDEFWDAYFTYMSY